MANFTKGPWRIGDAGLTVFGPPNGKSCPESIAHVTKRANAILIAAAPDLLEALKYVKTIINYNYNLKKSETVVNAFGYYQIALIDKAIDSAEGRPK